MSELRQFQTAAPPVQRTLDGARLEETPSIAQRGDGHARLAALEELLSHDAYERVPERVALWAEVVEILAKEPTLRTTLMVPEKLEELTEERKQQAQRGQCFYRTDNKGAKRVVLVKFPSGETHFYEGPKGAEHKVRAISGGETRFYKGGKGIERKVRVEWPGGQKQFFEGPKGAERKVRVEEPDGQKQFFEGPKGAEHNVRVEWPDGEKHFFKGPKGAEHMVRAVVPGGETRFYTGDQGAERNVRVEWPDGQKQFYEGEKGAERNVRVEWPDGSKHFFEPIDGVERRVCVALPTGETRFYKHDQGARRKVRVEWPDGKKQFYEGEKGAERKVRVEWPDGEKHFFQGDRGAERKVRVVFPDGEMRFYEGARGHEQCVRTAFPKGRADPDTYEAARRSRMDERETLAAPAAVARKMNGEHDGFKSKGRLRWIDDELRRQEQKQQERRLAGAAAAVRECVTEAIRNMPVMRQARLHDRMQVDRATTIQHAVRTWLCRRQHGATLCQSAWRGHCVRLLIRRQRAALEAARDEARAERQKIDKLRERNFKSDAAVDAQEQQLQKQRAWAREQRRLAKQTSLAEKAEAAREEAARLAREAQEALARQRKAKRDAAKVSGRVRCQPKLRANNLINLNKVNAHGRVALSSSDDDSQSTASAATSAKASQAISVAPTYVPTQTELPSMNSHARKRFALRRPEGMSLKQFNKLLKLALSKPDKKWAQPNQAGEMTTIILYENWKLYLDRQGQHIKTVVWKGEHGVESDTSEARASSSSSSSAPPTPPRALQHPVDAMIEMVHTEEAIRRSLEDHPVYFKSKASRSQEKRAQEDRDIPPAVPEMDEERLSEWLNARLQASLSAPRRVHAELSTRGDGRGCESGRES